MSATEHERADAAIRWIERSPYLYEARVTTADGADLYAGYVAVTPGADVWRGYVGRVFIPLGMGSLLVMRDIVAQGEKGVIHASS